MVCLAFNQFTTLCSSVMYWLLWHYNETIVNVLYMLTKKQIMFLWNSQQQIFKFNNIPILDNNWHYLISCLYINALEQNIKHLYSTFKKYNKRYALHLCQILFYWQMYSTWIWIYSVLKKHLCRYENFIVCNYEDQSCHWWINGKSNNSITFNAQPPHFKPKLEEISKHIPEWQSKLCLWEKSNDYIY